MLLPTDFIAAIGTAASQFILNIIMQTPYSQMLETEADEVGLSLASKACFDVREAIAFWYKMSVIQDEILPIPNTLPSFFNSHPSNETRCNHLDSLMDKAIQSRKECGCSPLPFGNPIERVKKMHDSIAEEYKLKKYAGILNIGKL